MEIDDHVSSVCARKAIGRHGIATATPVEKNRVPFNVIKLTRINQNVCEQVNLNGCDRIDLNVCERLEKTEFTYSVDTETQFKSLFD